MAPKYIKYNKVSPRPVFIDPVDIGRFAIGKQSNFYVALHEDAMGEALHLPFIVARGVKPGPVLGITAAVHGNELNGILIIQRLLTKIDLSSMKGALLCAPVVNVPGFNGGTRHFTDGVDLNLVFPGKPRGRPAEQYARAFSKVFLPACDFLIDIHTASQGRTNTMYVRVDYFSEMCRIMAHTVNPQIILHIPGGDGTLRHNAKVRGVPAITLEAGDPGRIQGRMVSEGETGIQNVMVQLGMIKGEVQRTRDPVLCKSSQWVRTIGGGIVRTCYKLADRISEGQLLAETINPFGEILQQYHAPFEGVVIGMATNPVASPGMRFCHLGAVGAPQPRKGRGMDHEKAIGEQSSKDNPTQETY